MTLTRSSSLFFVLVVLLSVTIAICSVEGEIHLWEPFHEGWEKNWVQSKAKEDYGEFKHTAGEWYGDAEEDKGIQTSQDAHQYAISRAMDKVVSNMDKPLVIQYSAKHPQGIDCGGAYLKVLPEDTNQEQFQGESPYNIMFGPDVCGSSTKKIHFIFNYKGKNIMWKKNVACETDKFTHLYTAIINPDATYEVQVDGVKKESGNLYEDWDFLPPKQIPDPNAKKPADWVDEPEIPDPEDKKPDDWDQPQYIPDPDAQKPDDWDSEEDGEWEPPMIENPEYKGEWKPKMIPNPAYKGEWKPPMIDNPDYEYDENVGKFNDMKYVGIEVWQVKAGTIFDNILITDSADEAKEKADAILERAKAEKEMHDKQEEEKKKQEEQNKQEEQTEEQNTEQNTQDNEQANNENKAEHDEL